MIRPERLRRKAVGAAALALLFFAYPTEARLPEKTTELCRIEEGMVRESLVVTPDLLKVAYVQKTPQGMRVVVNGKAGPHFREVFPVITFSRDGELAFCAKSDKGWMVIFGSKSFGPYDEIGAPTTDPSSGKVAYAAVKDHRAFVAVNGKEGPTFGKTGVPVWSAKGGRLAYFAEKNGTVYAVIDSKLQGGYLDAAAGSLSFSPDGRRYAYAARTQNGWSAVVDGQPGPAHQSVGLPVWSPDGRRIAYVAQNAKGLAVVVDGKPIYEGEGVGGPVFSPAGESVIHAAKVKGGWAVVSGGKQGPPAEQVGDYLAAPGGTCTAYVLKKSGKWYVDRCGKLEGPYDGIGKGSLVFDATGKTLAYSASLYGKWLAFANGQPGPGYDGVVTLGGAKLLPDGNRLRYLALNDGKIILVEEKL